MSTMLTTSEQILSPWDEHNQKLLENVRPPGWKNPTAKGRYNLVVIGAGTAGLVTAVGAATLGARVALVEKHLLGGDCLNYGCVPSKAVIRAARAAFAAREAADYGIRVEGLADVSFSEAMRRMRRLRGTISEHDSAHRLARLGVNVFLGSGSDLRKRSLPPAHGRPASRSPGWPRPAS
jgi:pyruvate/2-oxoglutarate dehydrogenase complex dihydrolipoamide dehydrogenase (E3) component